MMHGRGKSDSAIVAKKSANKAGPPATEGMEPRAETKGNAIQQSTCRAQNRAHAAGAVQSGCATRLAFRWFHCLLYFRFHLRCWIFR